MRPLSFILPVTSAALLLAGCTVGPRYVRPAMPTPQAFQMAAALDAGPAYASPAHTDPARTDPAHTGPAQGDVDLVAWWRLFHDPLLTRLVERGLAQNLDLQQAVARVAQSRAALKEAHAALLPSGQISGQGGEAYQSTQTPIGRLGSAFPQFERSTQTDELDIGASWEIDLFGGRSAARDAARAQWQASAAGAVATRLAVAAQIADTYVAIRMLQARRDVAQAQFDTQQRLVDLITLQYAKGVAARRDMQQAQGVLAQVRATVPLLQNQLDIAMHALDVLIGAQPGATQRELADNAVVPTAPAIATAGGPAELLRRRPDIIAAERTLAATNAGIGVAMSEYYPKFTLSGLLGTATTTPSGLFSGGATQANGVMGLRWRLFDFARVDAEIKAARGRHAEALAAYRLTVLRASQDVEDAFSTLAEQEARASALASGEAAMAKARDAAMAAYRNGYVSQADVLDADRRLLETRDSAIQAKAAAAQGAIASFRALGGGWNAASTSFAGR